MQVSYQYPGPSVCLNDGGVTTLGLSPDLSRKERASFRGRLKEPLAFRDAMLMLREIVLTDASIQKKDRTAFFQWLGQEVDRRAQAREMEGLREQLKREMEPFNNQIKEKMSVLEGLLSEQRALKKELDKTDAWNDYNMLERKFWKFIYDRDHSLWIVLDPVITVHKDQVSFEAFSLDESVYGCLAVDIKGFDLLAEPRLGTTNIDFSANLAKEMERFRTYNDVELAVNPEGFHVNTGQTVEYVEKKIDLPESWIKGFNQVSSAALMNGSTIELAPVDFYDICAALRRRKAHKSPRYMSWRLSPGEPVQITFAPYGEVLTLKAVYAGRQRREVKIWGRQRWLTMEKLIPLANKFTVKLLGFGMPQFIIADMGLLKMTVGFSSWSANDWVGGTAFNILSGFLDDSEYGSVYELMKEKRCLTMGEIAGSLGGKAEPAAIGGVGGLLKRGEGYFDAVKNAVRFRQLCNAPIPKHLYKTTKAELDVQKLMASNLDRFFMKTTPAGETVFTNAYGREHTDLTIDADGQISDVKCTCSAFNRGPRNISAPCPHIMALYLAGGRQMGNE